MTDVEHFSYVYHVVYMTTSFHPEFNNNNIYGNCTLYRVRPIDTETETDSVKDFISNEYCHGNPVILLNFILLNDKGR